MNQHLTRKDLLIEVLSVPTLVGAVSKDAGEAMKSTRSTITVRYLGTAGWEIVNGATTILVDPYLSRIRGPVPPGAPAGEFAPAPGDTRRTFGWDDVAAPDTATLDAHIIRANYILVTHTHYDHVFDVPYIARKTHAMIIGSESTANVMRAYGLPEEQLITVRGGEDFQFDTFSLSVIPSIHGALNHKHYFSSQQAPKGMTAPLTLKQMHPEGGTLAYFIRFGGHQILAFGSMNYIEREIDGLRPDIVIAGAGTSRSEIYDYSARLMRVLRDPEVVLPTHWDNFMVPYDTSQQANITALQSFVHEIKSASPRTKVIVPKYFETLQLA